MIDRKTYPYNAIYNIYEAFVDKSEDTEKGFEYALSQLSVESREIITLVFNEHISPKQIAEKYGCTYQNVMNRLNAAKRIMWRYSKWVFDGYEKTKERREKLQRNYAPLKFSPDTPICECELSTRAFNRMWIMVEPKENGNLTVGDIDEAIRTGKLTIGNGRKLGAKTAKEIEEKLGVKFPKR